jgi:hypothetical protein
MFKLCNNGQKRITSVFVFIVGNWMGLLETLIATMKLSAGTGGNI